MNQWPRHVLNASPRQMLCGSVVGLRVSGDILMVQLILSYDHSGVPAAEEVR